MMVVHYCLMTSDKDPVWQWMFLGGNCLLQGVQKTHTATTLNFGHDFFFFCLLLYFGTPCIVFIKKNCSDTITEHDSSKCDLHSWYLCKRNVNALSFVHWFWISFETLASELGQENNWPGFRSGIATNKVLDRQTIDENKRTMNHLGIIYTFLKKIFCRSWPHFCSIEANSSLGGSEQK